MSRRKKLQHQIDRLQHEAEQNTQQSTQVFGALNQPGSEQLEGVDLSGLTRPVAPTAPTDPTEQVSADLASHDNQLKQYARLPGGKNSAPYKARLAQLLSADPRIAQYHQQQADYIKAQTDYSQQLDQYNQQVEQRRQQLYTSNQQSLNPNVQQDPRLQQAQLGALNNLQQIGQQGFTQQDQAALNSAMMQSGQQEKAERDAQLQQARSRGMGGSGLEFASALQAQQGAANRNYQTAADLGVQARQRALDAVIASGQMAQGMQGQDYQRQAQQYGQQANQAGALDAFRQWATGNRGGATQTAFQNAFGTAQGQTGALQGAATLNYQGAGQAQQQLQTQNQMISGALNNIVSAAGSFA